MQKVAETLQEILRRESFSLSPNATIPKLGFGSGTAWYKGPSGNSDGADEQQAEFFLYALEKGLIHLDLAEMYGNEKSVGLAIKRWLAKGNSRKELFVTSKLAHTHGAEEVSRQLDLVLERTGLSYVDLYLWHAPFGHQKDNVPLIGTWREFEKCKDSGRALEVGVSNFFLSHLKELYSNKLVHPPTCNQVEFHPYVMGSFGETQTFCQEHNILLASYGSLSSLSNPGPVDVAVETLSKKYGVSKASILQRWCLDQGVVVLTTSQKRERLDTYTEMFSFKLSREEVNEVSELGKKREMRRFWSKYHHFCK